MYHHSTRLSTDLDIKYGDNALEIRFGSVSLSMSLGVAIVRTAAGQTRGDSLA